MLWLTGPQMSLRLQWAAKRQIGVTITKDWSIELARIEGAKAMQSSGT